MAVFRLVARVAFAMVSGAALFGSVGAAARPLSAQEGALVHSCIDSENVGRGDYGATILSAIEENLRTKVGLPSTDFDQAALDAIDAANSEFDEVQFNCLNELTMAVPSLANGFTQLTDSQGMVSRLANARVIGSHIEARLKRAGLDAGRIKRAILAAPPTANHKTVTDQSFRAMDVDLNSVSAIEREFAYVYAAIVFDERRAVVP